jgi:hypothetical protein
MQPNSLRPTALFCQKQQTPEQLSMQYKKHGGHNEKTAAGLTKFKMNGISTYTQKRGNDRWGRIRSANGLFG